MAIKVIKIHLIAVVSHHHNLFTFFEINIDMK